MDLKLLRLPCCGGSFDEVIRQLKKATGLDPNEPIGHPSTWPELKP